MKRFICGNVVVKKYLVLKKSPVHIPKEIKWRIKRHLIDTNWVWRYNTYIVNKKEFENGFKIRNIG